MIFKENEFDPWPKKRQSHPYFIWGGESILWRWRFGIGVLSHDPASSHHQLPNSHMYLWYSVSTFHCSCCLSSLGTWFWVKYSLSWGGNVSRVWADQLWGVWSCIFLRRFTLQLPACCPESAKEWIKKLFPSQQHSHNAIFMTGIPRHPVYMLFRLSLTGCSREFQHTKAHAQLKYHNFYRFETLLLNVFI